MFSCEFMFSEEFLHQAVVEHGKIRFARKVMTVVKGLCLVCLLAISALLFFGMRNVGGGSLFIGFSLLLVFSRSIDRHLLRWRFRKSPYWNRRIRVELVEDGVRTSSELGDSTVLWPAFTRVVGLRHGFLLYQGPQVFNWLPLSAFQSAPSRDSIAALLRAKAIRYEEKMA
jgi:hypothetical protein